MLHESVSNSHLLHDVIFELGLFVFGLLTSNIYTSCAFIELLCLFNLNSETWQKLNIILYWHFSLRKYPWPTYHVR
jgi:hypothetical protein